MLEVSRKDPPALAAFELLKAVTPLRPFRGMVRGTWEAEDVCAFEFTHGDDELPTTETVVCFLGGEAARLPPFLVGPRIGHPFDWLVGRKDVVVTAHPRFPHEYELCKHPAHEAAEQELQALFTADVMDYFVAHPVLRVESLGRQLLVYRAGLVVPVDEIESFVGEGYGLLAALLRAARPAKSESTAPAV